MVVFAGWGGEVDLVFAERVLGQGENAAHPGDVDKLMMLTMLIMLTVAMMLPNSDAKGQAALLPA